MNPKRAKKLNAVDAICKVPVAPIALFFSLELQGWSAAQ
jgi:hypothetical protein